MIRVLALYVAPVSTRDFYGPTAVRFIELRDDMQMYQYGGECAAVHYLTFDSREAFESYKRRESEHLKVQA